MSLQKLFSSTKPFKRLKQQVLGHAKKVCMEGLAMNMGQERIEHNVRKIIIDSIFSDEWVKVWSSLSRERKIDGADWFYLRERANIFLDSFHLPILPRKRIPSPLKIGIAGAIGALVGMILYPYSNSYPAIYASASLGSLLFVSSALFISMNSLSIPVAGKLLDRFARKLLSLKPEEDTCLAHLADTVITTWIDGVIYLVFTLITSGRYGNQRVDDTDCSRLIEKIQALRITEREELPLAVDELVQFIEIMGYDVPMEQKTFCWTEEDRNRYETYGHVRDGDEVIVKVLPVIHEGKVKKKGLVIKKVS